MQHVLRSYIDWDLHSISLTVPKPDSWNFSLISVSSSPRESNNSLYGYLRSSKELERAIYKRFLRALIYGVFQMRCLKISLKQKTISFFSPSSEPSTILLYWIQWINGIVWWKVKCRYLVDFVFLDYQADDDSRGYCRL